MLRSIKKDGFAGEIIYLTLVVETRLMERTTEASITGVQIIGSPDDRGNDHLQRSSNSRSHYHLAVVQMTYAPAHLALHTRLSPCLSCQQFPAQRLSCSTTLAQVAPYL